MTDHLWTGWEGDDKDAVLLRYLGRRPGWKAAG
jgi:hypothetical protein